MKIFGQSNKNNNIMRGLGMAPLFLILGAIIAGCGGGGGLPSGITPPSVPVMRATAAKTVVGPIKSVDLQTTSGYGEWINLPQDKIDAHVASTMSTGANTIAFAMPYDYPDRYGWWPNSIHNRGGRAYHRPHFNRWEGVNGAPGNMTPNEYVDSYYKFVIANPTYYRAGDIVDACTEPENGKYWINKFGGEWHKNPTAKAEFNKFIRDLKDTGDAAFAQIGLGGKIITNIVSTNGFIADKDNGVLEEATVNKLGILTIDHYVGQDSQNLTDLDQMASQMERDLEKYHNQWKVPIAIGEWGYHRHVDVSDEQQKLALQKMLAVFNKPYIVLVNYWVGIGHHPKIINDEGGMPTNLRPAAYVLKDFFNTFNSSATLDTTVVTPTPAPTPIPGGASKVLVLGDFESGSCNFIDDGGIDGKVGSNGNTGSALQLHMQARSSAGVKKSIGGIVLGDYSTLQFDINTGGSKLYKGDATQVYFNQGGVKSIYLLDQGLIKDNFNGWQRITVPLNSIADLNLKSDAAYIGLGFWNEKDVTYLVDNIQLLAGNITTTPSPTPNPNGKVIANFDSGHDGWVGGQIVAGTLEITNPANDSRGSSKVFDGGLPLSGYNTIELDINLNGIRLYADPQSRDSSLLYFDQNGQKGVRLIDYIQTNGTNNTQHIAIPLSDFAGLNPNATIVKIGFRFWNDKAGRCNIDNLTLTTR